MLAARGVGEQVQRVAVGTVAGDADQVGGAGAGLAGVAGGDEGGGVVAGEWVGEGAGGELVSIRGLQGGAVSGAAENDGCSSAGAGAVVSHHVLDVVPGEVAVQDDGIGPVAGAVEAGVDPGSGPAGVGWAAECPGAVAR